MTDNQYIIEMDLWIAGMEARLKNQHNDKIFYEDMLTLTRKTVGIYSIKLKAGVEEYNKWRKERKLKPVCL